MPPMLTNWLLMHYFYAPSMFRQHLQTHFCMLRKKKMKVALSGNIPVSQTDNRES